MPSVRISKDNKAVMVFVTMTVKNWYDLFDRYERFQILADAFIYAQRYKGFKLYAYVLMLNHLRFIGEAPDMIAVIRDFKRHTTKALLVNIRSFEPNIERLFTEEDGTHAIWQSTNMPIVLESDAVLEQKAHYVHNNPVRKQYVMEPAYWMWSSANPKSPIRIDHWEG